MPHQMDGCRSRSETAPAWTGGPPRVRQQSSVAPGDLPRSPQNFHRSMRSCREVLQAGPPQPRRSITSGTPSGPQARSTPPERAAGSVDPLTQPGYPHLALERVALGVHTNSSSNWYRNRWPPPVRLLAYVLLPRRVLPPPPPPPRSPPYPGLIPAHLRPLSVCTRVGGPLRAPRTLSGRAAVQEG